MGSLYIVATPIGNLEDITVRAQKVLASVDYILAEDTRVSVNLLNHIGVVKPMKPYHDFNKERVTPAIMNDLKDGKSIAIISDAGTPGIADPAFNLVRAALQEHIPVIPIAGPCALIAALCASGMPTDRFIFENFLPPNTSRRKKILQSFTTEKRTVIFYESPHRIIKVLADMQEVFGDIQIVIARELTKIYEEFLRGTPQQLHDHFLKAKPRGEMIVLFNTRYSAPGYQPPETDKKEAD
jgi:16S rRNA (cytidine1402-2'-O)-methyltransferase